MSSPIIDSSIRLNARSDTDLEQALVPILRRFLRSNTSVVQVLENTEKKLVEIKEC